MTLLTLCLLWVVLRVQLRVLRTQETLLQALQQEQLPELLLELLAKQVPNLPVPLQSHPHRAAFSYTLQ